MTGAIRPPRSPVGIERRVREALHGRGLRCTTTRVQAMQILTASGRHLTVPQIYERMSTSHQSLDISSVYRTVATLEQLGLVHAVTVCDRPAAYGPADEPHHHAICTCCGTTTEVPAARLAQAVRSARRGSDFTLADHASLELHGLCPACRA